MKNTSNLSDKERQVINRYMKNGFNKAKALKEVGYAETVCDNPKQIFGRPAVEKEIERRMKIVSTKAGIDAAYVIEKVVEIIEADIGTLLSFDPEKGTLDFDWSRLTEEQKRAIGEFQVEKFQKGRGDNATPVVRTKVRPHDKLKALEFLAKHLGMFKEKLEISGEQDVAARILANRKRMVKDDNDNGDKID